MDTKRVTSEGASLADGKCPVCGKAFAYYAGLWAYKIILRRGGRILYFCSWSCLCAWRKAHPDMRLSENKKANKKRNEEIYRVYLAEKPSYRELGERYGLSPQSIGRIITKISDEKDREESKKG